MTELVITWQGLLFEAVSFLVFTFLLNLFLFKPINRIIKKRAQIIETHLNTKNNLDSGIEGFGFKTDEEKRKLKQGIHDLKSRTGSEARAEASKKTRETRERALARSGAILDEFQRKKGSLEEVYMEKTSEISSLICKKISG